MPAVPFPPGSDLVCGAEAFRFHPGLRQIRDHIGGHAAPDLLHPLHGQPGDHLSVENALLPVAQGEVGVGAEAEQRRLIVGQIIVQVAHVVFLIDAQQRPDGIPQGDPLILQVFQRVQAQDAGSLVVQHAPADDVALPAPQGEGVLRPAHTGHHVQMGDGGQIICPLPHLGIAHPVLAVMGLQTQLPGDLQSQRQSLGRAFPEGHPGLFLPHHAVNGHQAADVPDNVLPVFLHKAVYIPHKFLVHIDLLPE